MTEQSSQPVARKKTEKRVIRRGDPLSRSETVVAQMVANGLTNDEIAQLTDTLSCTIKVHLRTIFIKLGITRRTMILKYFAPQRVYHVLRDAVQELSDDERQLLNDMATGDADADIAFSRNVNNSKIHAEVMRVKKALGFNSRNELVMWWLVESGQIKQSREPLDREQQHVLDGRDHQYVHPSVRDHIDA